MKQLFLITAFLLSTGCTTQSTQEFGQRIDATSEVVESSLCGTQTFKNLEGAVINALRMVPFFTDWQSVCQSASD